MDVVVNGTSAYANTAGRDYDPEAETVVFIHGVGQDHTIWALPTRYFAHHGRNVLAVDLPGHGRSEGEAMFSIEAMSDWVVDLLQTLEVGKAALVGHSMGSLIALDAAARFPDIVTALVMVGVSVPLSVAAPLMKAADDESADARAMLTYWSYSRAAQLGGNPTPGMWMVGSNLRLLEQAGPAAIRAGLQACAAYEAGLQRAAEMECPALLLAGERDRMTPLRGAAELQTLIPHLRTVVFPGAGHPILAERSDQVLDELITIV